MTSKVLTNDDLLHEIFQYCSKQDITSRRQCSRRFDTIASYYLFASLTISFRKKYVRRLKRIAESEKFSKGVRELVWETGAYRRDKGPYTADQVKVLLQHGLGDESATEESPDFDKRLGILVARLNALARDEVETCAHHNQAWFLFNVVPALRLLTGVNRVILTPWRNDLPLFDADTMKGRTSGMPPPFQTLFDSAEARRQHRASFLAALHALSKSGHELTSLSVLPAPNTTLNRTTASKIDIPGFCFKWDRFVKILESNVHCLRPLKKLRKLDLDIGNPNTPPFSKSSPRQLEIKDDSVKRLLSQFTELESLYLRAHSSVYTRRRERRAIIPLDRFLDTGMFNNLRHLHLDSFWLKSSDYLCALLIGHSFTLEQVKLSNINIGGTHDLIPDERGFVYLPLPEYRLYRWEDQSQSEWLQVAKTCQTLPKLNGLLIESPSVSVDWAYLSLYDTEELMEIGMDGRENTLYGGGIQLEM